MAKGNRKNNGTAFKAKVAIEAIKEQQTFSEFADRLKSIGIDVVFHMRWTETGLVFHNILT
ncbi:MAG: hypothetical protein ACP5VS_16935 [Desulfomonilaceae bacterium]